MVPLVIDLHPALPSAGRTIAKHINIINSCPIASKVYPKGSIFPTYRALPNLQSKIAPANIFKLSRISPSSTPRGYYASGDNCNLCKNSSFGDVFSSPSIPHLKMPINKSLCCRTVRLAIYAILCQLCNVIYVGKTTNIKPRWSNHLSHIKKNVFSCELSGAISSDLYRASGGGHLKCQILNT